MKTPSPLTLSPTTDMLGVIDVQPDFMPGGALPVPHGDKVIGPINTLLTRYFSQAFATQDWHPKGHCSFASSHPPHRPLETISLPYGPQTLWPDHAVQDTPGARLHPQLTTAAIQLIIRKGTHREADSYSAFFDNGHTYSTGLAAWLRAQGIKRLFFCGLALEYCVLFSALDAKKAGFEAFVIEDATQALNTPFADGTTSRQKALKDLSQHSIGLITTQKLRAFKKG
ncbi:bifunctional nicotinamidase/pyrazinamidase [Entomobacter blattae]|uniref:nicotinamidase n=1 Tax=Entomobacter blattae TaxID=2762277 RepID=A0A7H1NRB3_9PROT|nr:bifunctional nicotinamidase/pyrazinamidase [Entomobacter blattae]QNT78323.1 Isochorismatase family protein [Entomobacter blattae]